MDTPEHAVELERRITAILENIVPCLPKLWRIFERLLTRVRDHSISMGKFQFDGWPISAKIVLNHSICKSNGLPPLILENWIVERIPPSSSSWPTTPE